jgi:uncharacterized protein (DUF697 family)
MTEQQSIFKPFALAAVIWVALGWVACRYFSESGEMQKNLVWLFGLWALCLADLVALGKTIQGVLAIAAGGPNAGENLAPRVIHTFSWGLIKLVCLGIFALVMIKGKPIPTAGLLAGMATLLVVPLMGGLFWSQRVLGVS